jgi:hypothetical protein
MKVKTHLKAGQTIINAEQTNTSTVEVTQSNSVTVGGGGMG